MSFQHVTYGVRDQSRTSVKEENTKVLGDLYEQKIQTLSEGVVFWRERCSNLASDFFKAFQQLRDENEVYKSHLLELVSRLQGNTDFAVKKIKDAYKRVRMSGLLVLTLFVGTS